jgi:hypothetical protein
MRTASPIEFDGLLWRYGGPSSWVFVTVPEAMAFPPMSGFGRTPVRARVTGGAWWPTSTWWDTRSSATLLAVPKRVRGPLDHGDRVHVELELDPSRL